MVFPTVLSMVSPVQEVKKSWHVEWFYGNDLKAYWTKFNNAGVGTFAMVDDKNEGFSVICDSGANDNSELNYGNIRHYDSEAFEQISVWRRGALAVDGQVAFGVTDEPNGVIGSSVNNQINFVDGDDTANKSFLHNNGVSPVSVIDSGVPVDTLFHKYRIKATATFALGFIDGILRATATTDIPTGSVQPAMFVRTFLGTAFEGRIRRHEIYNT
jgi:hypothetical protein